MKRETWVTVGVPLLVAGLLGARWFFANLDGPPSRQAMENVTSQAVAKTFAPPQAPVEETPVTRTVPRGSAEPVWRGRVRSRDGRVFYTDGSILLDAARFPSSHPPLEVIETDWADQFFARVPPDACTVDQLQPGKTGSTVRTPSGVGIGVGYLDYVRSVLGDERLELRTSGPRDGVMILKAGEPVGAVMPVVD